MSPFLFSCQFMLANLLIYRHLVVLLQATSAFSPFCMKCLKTLKLFRGTIPSKHIYFIKYYHYRPQILNFCFLLVF
ncbi:hypothetical protein EP10_002857 [Geobacillus icigianus]|uniref:Secreted protein n=1 Tax=Geobacillus icigianus TaxID=1430331 RepID=A0ABU6BIY5_9BACL|nr:hypothetical protein [Geobacillus icigianus]